MKNAKANSSNGKRKSLKVEHEFVCSKLEFLMFGTLIVDASGAS